MWDQRYSTSEYVYGTEPNEFLKQNSHYLSGPVLSIAEGEGRNAVFLASLELETLGVDSSEVGLIKAQKLAKRKGVSIQTETVDLADYSPVESSFGSVISIFAHLPVSIQKRLYPLIERSLKPGGIILIEAYSKKQITRNTGGPKEIDLLLSQDDLEQAFPNCTPILSHEIERIVTEGKFHNGIASVVQFIARKNDSPASEE
jgi:cyclopropane fatty-acyl-phospholipid synthase-like methyltransferase